MTNLSRLGRTLLAAVFLALGPAPVSAQTGLPPGCPPPPLLHVVRSGLAPGGELADADLAARRAQERRRTAAVPSLDFVAVTGAPESWRFTGLPTFTAWQAELERTEPAADAASAPPVRQAAYLAKYRPDLSYRADVDLSRARYVMAALIQVKPGQGAAFRELRERDAAAHVAAEADENWAVYEVIAGAPSGAFLMLTPMSSLAYEDDVPRLFLARIRAAAGEAGRQRQRELTIDAIEGVDTTFLRLRPRSSLPPASWRERDPAVWGR